MSDYILTKKKFKSSFDILPNEILLHIFDYLTSNDIIYSFIDCNQRLQNLLLTQKYHCEIPKINLNFWNKILPIIGSQIQTLVINIDYLTVSLDLFSNLTSIIISSPYSLLNGQLRSILDHQCFQQLHTFKINHAILSNRSSDKNVLDDEQILFKKIFNKNNNLQIFQYLPALGGLSYRNLDQLNSNIHIRSLTLNLTHFQDIFNLIENTPNLIYLNIQSQMPYKESEEYASKNISEIKLEEFYLKFKSRRIIGYPSYFPTNDLDQLLRAIQLFSSSLNTLSLNFINVESLDSNDVLINGDRLENQLLKYMKKLKIFYIYAGINDSKNIQEILSTFQTFPWSIGVHENAYLISLPFRFHELKYFRGFEYVLSNNDEILKSDHQLWSNVTSIEFIPIDQTDLKNLLPLIKFNMPKLSSITFFDKNRYDAHYHKDSSDSCNEIERINVQLDSVKTVCLIRISMKKIQQILMYSFPNLQCLILDHTELPSKENELTSFLDQKIQRMESDEFFAGKNPTEKQDFGYLSNLKHLKLTYGVAHNDRRLNSRSRIVSNSLTKLPKLERLSIYAIPCSGCIVYDSEDIFDPILNRLDQDQIKTKYEIKYCGQYMWFIRNTVSYSF